MALPVQSVRAAAEHRDVLQAVADLLKAGEAERLRHWLADARQHPVGPFKSEAAALAFLRDRLVSELGPRMIWLFGSRARGDMRPDSDFDLLVVLPDGLPERAYTHAAVPGMHVWRADLAALDRLTGYAPALRYPLSGGDLPAVPEDAQLAEAAPELECLHDALVAWCAER